jgi:hypothetical protein
LIAIPAKSIRRGVARLKVLSQPLKNKLAGIAPRSGNDYATHVPILVGIAQRFKIRRILELGCGAFSTPTFLNPEVFSDLEQLHSYETDRSWYEKTLTAFSYDQRYQPRFVEGVMSAGLQEIELGQFDLIFVDDSTSAIDRAETIQHLTNRQLSRQLIVIHDFEIRNYRDAASSLEHRQIFRAFTPQTGVVWNGSNDRVEVLKKLSRQISGHSRSISVEDVESWRRLFREE